MKTGIKLKLSLAFSSLLFLAVIMAFWGWSSLNKVRDLYEVNRSIEEIQIAFGEAIQSEKQFLMIEPSRSEFFETKTSVHLNDFGVALDDAEQIFTQLRENGYLKEFGSYDKLMNLEAQVAQYRKLVMNDLQASIMNRGFKDHGAEGALREAIHAVEDSPFPYDRAQMLMLRRHEKDFFLRKDLKYLEKFNRQIESFIAQIDSTTTADIPNFATEKRAVINYLETYQQTFASIVEVTQVIGLNEQSGMLGKVNALTQKTSSSLSDFSNEIDDNVSQAVTTTVSWFIGLFILMVAAGLLLTRILTILLSRPIVMMKDKLVTLSEGTFPEAFEDPGQDEVGQAKTALNNLMERIRTASDFATEIGVGKLNTDYPDRFANDVLATALIDMRGKLTENAEAEGHRQWSTMGWARLSEVLRSNQSELEELSHRLVSELVHYLEANQGAIFLLNEKKDHEEETLKLMSTYAYNRKKYRQGIIHKGEGLVGQCWVEGETIFMTKVPDNYIRIESGLGDALPTCVLLVPLKVDDKVMGVLELASFQVFAPHQIELVEKLAESIASTVSTVRVNQVTASLLEEQSELMQNLRAQEEELRQNQEELMTTQEEMTRRLEESERTILQKDHTIGEQERQLEQLKHHHTQFGSFIELNGEKKMTAVLKSKEHFQQLKIFLNKIDDGEEEGDTSEDSEGSRPLKGWSLS